MSPGRGPEIAVIGAGIVGAACAHALAERGALLTVFDLAFPGSGATAEGMGHLALMDDNDAEFALCLRSQELWRDYRTRLPLDAAYDACGALWVAQNQTQAAALEKRFQRFRTLGIPAELLSPTEISKAETTLRTGWALGLKLPADSVVYPPAIAASLLRRHNVRLIRAMVTAVSDQTVQTDEREVGPFDGVVVAAGAQTSRLIPDAPVVPRKGHLAITTRMRRMLNSQVADVSYLDTAHTPGAEGVSFNVQPRTTGQVLIGSSRQYAGFDRSVDPTVLREMLRLAVEGMPALAGTSILRIWTGFRPATPDGLPLIGRMSPKGALWVASGHEGLGITQSLATAELIADQFFDRPPQLDPRPFLPTRFKPAETFGGAETIESAV